MLLKVCGKYFPFFLLLIWSAWPGTGELLTPGTKPIPCTPPPADLPPPFSLHCTDNVMGAFRYGQRCVLSISVYSEEVPSRGWRRSLQLYCLTHSVKIFQLLILPKSWLSQQWWYDIWFSSKCPSIAACSYKVYMTILLWLTFKWKLLDLFHSLVYLLQIRYTVL